MTDVLDKMWQGFFETRNKPLHFRFQGKYRALVVETNDPLRVHRIKFLCPELHDANVNPSDAPWAVPATDFGTKGCGRWSYPCIGDYVWIEFEKQHAYAPVYTGFCDPTRRRFYTLPSIYGPTPIPVDPRGNPVPQNRRPVDFDPDYMPRDNRPMSHGWQDRYGNLDVHNAVGFFPAEHRDAPPPPGVDAFTSNLMQQAKKSINFESNEARPKVNDPDTKYMLRMSKYGHMMIQSDIGYLWKRDGDQGEFTGDFDQDAQFEVDRWLYIQKLINEDAPSGKDQRRLMLMSRLGHKLEFRDVGWNRTRDGEFGPASDISDSDLDERWVKLRTKGGHLIQASDIGFDPINDEYVSRLLLDEARNAGDLDNEKSFGNDARFLRFVTRSGIKIAIDDRTSNVTRAHAEDLTNEEIGIGVLLKGRATPGAGAAYGALSGDPKGFYWQFDERPERNSTTWGTPLGSAIEMTDDREAIVIAPGLRNLPTQWERLRNNEFLTQSAFDLSPHEEAHHLIIDHELETIRLKTRAGQGENPFFPRTSSSSGEHAGLEMRDGPSGSAWLELIDIESRGIWFSQEVGVGIWRAKSGSDMAVWIDDQQNQIVVRNNLGKIQIFCSGDTEIKSSANINLDAALSINLKAGLGINMQTPTGQFSFSDAFDASGDIRGNNILGIFPQIKQGDGGTPGSPSGTPSPAVSIPTTPLPSKTEPDDRYPG